MSRSFCSVTGVTPSPLPFQNPSTHTRTGGFDPLSPPEVRARAACFVFFASRLWVNHAFNRRKASATSWSRRAAWSPILRT